MTLRPEPSRFLAIVARAHIVLGYAVLAVLPVTLVSYLWETMAATCSGESCLYPWLLLLGVGPAIPLGAFLLLAGYLLRQKKPVGRGLASVIPLALIVVPVWMFPHVYNIIDVRAFSYLFTEIGFWIWLPTLVIPLLVGVWLLRVLWSADITAKLSPASKVKA